LLLLCTPITKSIVDPVSQVGVGSKSGIQLPLANCIGVGFWSLWVFGVDQSVINPVVFQAVWALRLQLVALSVALLLLILLLLLLRLCSIKLC
jgi:hypothetical protein